MHFKSKSTTYTVAADAALYLRRSGALRTAAVNKRMARDMSYRAPKPVTYGRVVSNWMLGLPN